jgi:hypothetical protein
MKVAAGTTRAEGPGMTALAKLALASALSTALLGSIAGAVSAVPTDFQSIVRRTVTPEVAPCEEAEDAPPVSARATDAGVLPSS